MEIKDVTFSYDNQTDLLKSVNGEIETGKITAIIGPNGCGKSTLLAIMSQVYSPRSGQIILDGKAISRYKPKELARKLAVVHQHNDAPSDMTLEKLVSYGRLPYKRWFPQGSDEDDDTVEWAISCTNLHAKRGMRLDELSGGERQRAWIAMALAQRTPFLFLDEPTTYLDIYYQFEILELIRRLNKEYGLTIVMVLHDINQAIRYSDRIMMMKDGQIVMKGSPRDVITKESIKSVFGVDVVVKHDSATGLYIVPVGI